MKTMPTTPNLDDFESGRFYRRWIRFTIIMAVVLFWLGVANAVFLCLGVVTHKPASVISGLIGISISTWSVARAPKNIRYIRQKWREMDALTASVKALEAEIEKARGQQQ